MEGPMQRHRELYKTPSVLPWRETFRQRCVQRLKKSRARLLERYRQLGEHAVQDRSDPSLVQEVMEVEWKVLKSDNVLLPSLPKRDDFSQALEDSELAVWEEIQQELMLQEELTREEYERSQQFDEECFNAILDGLDGESGVICPVCRRNNLTVTSQFVTCHCGLSLATPDMTEEKLRVLLEDSVTEHSQHCWVHPEFTVIDGTEGQSSLLMICQACDTWAAIL